MPYDPPPELASLSLPEIADLVTARKLPPVENWSPQSTGSSHMRIAANGSWYHDGSLIKRSAMVRAFASLLMCDSKGRHWLVTPFQKLSIEVEDAAFIATDISERDGGLAFRLNTDDLVVADAEHKLRAEGSQDTPALYLAVRHSCEARLNRSTYQQLADIALAANDDWQVTSMGETFSLLPA